MSEKKEQKEQREAEEKIETKEENVSEEKKEADTEELVKKSELDAAIASSEDFKRRLYAVTAEYDNYRKRMANTASVKYLEGREDVIEKFFIIGDNLDRALAVASDEKMKQGIEMIIKAYNKILEEEKVESFDPTGEEFNAATSTAITAFPAAEGDKPGHVKLTLAKGYKRGDKILRFAQVAVVKED